MKNDSLRIRLHARIQPYLVLTLRSVIEAALFFVLFFGLKTLTVSFGFPVLYVAVPAALILFAAIVPLRFGTILFFWNREQNADSKIRDLFVFFSPGLFLTAVKNGLVLFLFSLLCFLVFFLPCLSMFALMCYTVFNQSPLLLSGSCFAAFVLLFFSGTAAWLTVKKLTFLSRYLFVASPREKGVDSLLESARLLNGRTFSVTAVKTKNFFSRLFCVFIFPAGLLIRRCIERNARLANELLKERE